MWLRSCCCGVVEFGVICTYSRAVLQCPSFDPFREHTTVDPSSPRPPRHVGPSKFLSIRNWPLKVHFLRTTGPINPDGAVPPLHVLVTAAAPPLSDPGRLSTGPSQCTPSTHPPEALPYSPQPTPAPLPSSLERLIPFGRPLLYLLLVLIPNSISFLPLSPRISRPPSITPLLLLLCYCRVPAS